MPKRLLIITGVLIVVALGIVFLLRDSESPAPASWTPPESVPSVQPAFRGPVGDPFVEGPQGQPPVR